MEGGKGTGWTRRRPRSLPKLGSLLIYINASTRQCLALASPGTVKSKGLARLQASLPSRHRVASIIHSYFARIKIELGTPIWSRYDLWRHSFNTVPRTCPGAKSIFWIYLSRYNGTSNARNESRTEFRRSFRPVTLETPRRFHSVVININTS